MTPEFNSLMANLLEEPKPKPKKAQAASGPPVVTKQKLQPVLNSNVRFAPIKLNDGTMLTPDQFNTSARNGMPYNSPQAMADYYNGWARKPGTDFQIAPYYRQYGNANRIEGGDVARVYAKYQNDPKVMEILRRATAPGSLTPGSTAAPQWGPEDGDFVRALIAKEQQDPLAIASKIGLPKNLLDK